MSNRLRIFFGVMSGVAITAALIYFGAPPRSFTSDMLLVVIGILGLIGIVVWVLSGIGAKWLSIFEQMQRRK